MYHRGESLSMGVLCPGGSLSREVSVQGGLCQGDPPYSKVRAVRILLECIIVPSMIVNGQRLNRSSLIALVISGYLKFKVSF